MLTLLPLLATLLTQKASASTDQCHAVSSVSFCETEQAYDFSLPSRTFTLAKAEFHDQMLSRLVAVSPGPWELTAPVAIWLVVPEINPDAAALRVVATYPNGQVVIPLTFEDVTRFLVQEGPISFIPTGRAYPDNYGYHVGRILTKLRPGVNPSDIESHLLVAPKKISSQWWEWQVTPFQEEQVINTFLKDEVTRGMIEQASTSQIFEWSANRDLVIQFPAAGDETPSGNH